MDLVPWQPPLGVRVCLGEAGCEVERGGFVGGDVFEVAEERETWKGGRGEGCGGGPLEGEGDVGVWDEGVFEGCGDGYCEEGWGGSFAVCGA